MEPASRCQSVLNYGKEYGYQSIRAPYERELPSPADGLSADVSSEMCPAVPEPAYCSMLNTTIILSTVILLVMLYLVYVAYNSRMVMHPVLHDKQLFDVDSIPEPPPGAPCSDDDVVNENHAVKCIVCKRWLGGPAQWQDHLIGKLHKKNLKKYRPDHYYQGGVDTRNDAS